MTANRDTQGPGPTGASRPAAEKQEGRGAVELRLAAVHPEARRLLCTAALIADVAAPGTLEAISGGGPQARALVTELQRAGLLATDEPIRCADPAVTDVVRASLTRAEVDELRRSALGAAIDAGTSSEVLVPLAAACDPAGDPVIVDLLAAAAEQHLRANAPDRALDLLRRALREPPASARAADLRGKLALASILTGEPGATALVRRAALQLAPVDGAHLVRRACLVLAGQGRTREATKLAQDVSRHLTSADDEVRSIIQLGWLAAAKLDLSLRPAVRRYLASVSPARLDTSPSGRSLAGVTAYELSLIGEDRDRTVELARRALDLRGGAGLTADMPSIWSAVLALLFADELEDAATALDRLERRGQQRGREPDVLAAHHLRVAVDRQRGRLASAHRSAAIVLDGIRRGWPGMAPGAAGERCRLALLAGRLDQAKAALELEGGLEQHADSPTLVSFLDARGRLRHRQGRYTEALEDHLCVRDRHEVLGAVNPATILWSQGAARAMAALGRRSEALDLLEEQLERAQAWGAPRTIGALLTTTGVVRADRRGEDLVERAVQLLEPGSTPIDLTEAHLALARLAQRRGDDRKAERSARRAAQLAEATEACGLLADASMILGEIGAQNSGGPEARLTPAERRTAHLAAIGRTNAEIAAELYVSRKAVEYHLGNVYRKLGIRGRRHLAHALGGTETDGTGSDA